MMHMQLQTVVLTTLWMSGQEIKEYVEICELTLI